MKKSALILGAYMALFASSGFGAALNITQNFDVMAAGTTPPTGWSIQTVAGANTTWTNGPGAPIVLTGVATVPVTPLTLNDAPTANLNNGYNALGVSGLAGDRTIATAPSGIAGVIIESSPFLNNSGGNLLSFNISYDIKRFTVGAGTAGTPPGADELPGFWLFYSLDGTTWNNVVALNPTLANVPNTVGITTIPLTAVTLSSAWVNGANLSLRWVDDNGIASSPDQIIGLDNVHLTSVPEPATWSLLALGAVALIARRRKA